jgi:hypothetical protein
VLPVLFWGRARRAIGEPFSRKVKTSIAGVVNNIVASIKIPVFMKGMVMVNQINNEFRCMLPARKRKFMEQCITTLSVEFGFDDDGYREWEKEFQEICMEHGVSFLHVVSTLGIEDWFTRFESSDPYEAFSLYLLNHTPLAKQKEAAYKEWLKQLDQVSEESDGTKGLVEAFGDDAFWHHFEDGLTPQEAYDDIEIIDEVEDV